jgi:hypothetical protein
MKTVFVGPDWVELETEEHVTAGMAAIAVSFWQHNPRKTRVPTSWRVTYMGRTRRIYSDNIGNAGTCYVLVKGVKHWVR